MPIILSVSKLFYVTSESFHLFPLIRNMFEAGSVNCRHIALASYGNCFICLLPWKNVFLMSSSTSVESRNLSRHTDLFCGFLFPAAFCAWIKDLVSEKEMKMEKVDDPMVSNGWIV